MIWKSCGVGLRAASAPAAAAAAQEIRAGRRARRLRRSPHDTAGRRWRTPPRRVRPRRDRRAGTGSPACRPRGVRLVAAAAAPGNRAGRRRSERHPIGEIGILLERVVPRRAGHVRESTRTADASPRLGGRAMLRPIETTSDTARPMVNVRPGFRRGMSCPLLDASPDETARAGASTAARSTAAPVAPSTSAKRSSVTRRSDIGDWRPGLRPPDQKNAATVPTPAQAP